MNPGLVTPSSLFPESNHLPCPLACPETRSQKYTLDESLRKMKVKQRSKIHFPRHGHGRGRAGLCRPLRLSTPPCSPAGGLNPRAGSWVVVDLGAPSETGCSLLVVQLFLLPLARTCFPKSVPVSLGFAFWDPQKHFPLTTLHLLNKYIQTDPLSSWP